MKILLSGSNRGKRIEWIEKFGRLLLDEGFIPIFCKGRISSWNIKVDACIKINIFDSAHSYISNNITTFSSFL